MAYEGAHPIPVKSGGTGAATLTGVLTGNGTSAVTASTVTQYNVLVGGASNALTSIAPGAAGQALLSAGAAANPAFGAVTGASLIFLDTISATADASIDFLSVIDGTYDSYLVQFYNVYPSNDAVNLNMNISIDNGNNWIAANYISGANYNAYNTNTLTNSNSVTTSVITGGGQSNNVANAPLCGYLYLQNTTALFTINGHCSYFVSGGTLNQCFFFSGNTASSGTNAIQFLYTAGNVETGVFTIYAVKES